MLELLVSGLLPTWLCDCWSADLPPLLWLCSPLALAFTSSSPATLEDAARVTELPEMLRSASAVVLVWTTLIATTAPTATLLPAASALPVTFELVVWVAAIVTSPVAAIGAGPASIRAVVVLWTIATPTAGL